MNHQTTILDCGLRVALLPSASPVVYCGYQIGAGAQDEGENEEGLAHFCEHTTFKGTAERSALDIINCLESVGGELNAFTTKGDTVYYAAILQEHLSRAVDLLTDIVFRSVYPQSEIDKEVEVICDEIESYNDTPAELIYDDFENLLFKNTPLGHNILGTAQRVRSFQTADALRFTRKHYRPENMVFFIYGNVEMGEVIGFLETSLAKQGTLSALAASRGTALCGQGKPMALKSKLSTLSESNPQTIVLHKDTHQAHVMMGHSAYGFLHPRRTALMLLNNILGGPSLNARLNLSLREKRGLVYTVESSLASYDSTGAWSVYFGCDPDDVEQCMALVHKELAALCNQPLTPEQLNAARRQMKGQLGIAADNRESLALDMGKSYLHYGAPRSTQQVFDELDALTPDDLLVVAQDIFRPDQLTTLIYQ